MKFSIILLTFNRDDILDEQFNHLSKVVTSYKGKCEVILVDNNTDGKDRSKYIKQFNQSQYLQLNKNSGVSGGRNAGILAAKGEYLLFIDDDALIFPDDCLNCIENAFNQNQEIKILAFKSINFNTKKIDRAEFPHPDKKRNPDISFKTFRFIGVAHAIRKDLFQHIDLYQEDFFYMAEEWDLSYACLNAGFQILYYPTVWVYHKKHDAGRIVNMKVLENSLLNKMKIGYRFLNWHYFILNISVWVIFVLIRSRLRINIPLIFYRYYKWVQSTKIKRTTLNDNAVKYIRSCGGSLWRR